MVRRVKEVVPVVEEKKVERKKKRKGGKQLLSFGGEEEEDVQPVVKRKKFDERIVVDDGEVEEVKAKAPKENAAPPEKEVPKPEPIPGTAETKDAEPDDDEAALCDLHFIAGCESCKKWDTQADGEEEEEDDNDWMSHALSFKEDKLGKDLSYRQKALEELVVIDPREKERTLKEEMKAKRDARSGGGTGREWDQARNKKMARASAAAGRAAR
ncbi:putative Peptidyl-prolyl isomerase CWC27 [Glarea lozoyensis 74030]|uniref:Putative Peptidyl-prolyl isomerase CWC27 n=1 Tax=Glarea lozoyensis (strain ATCC 74030 / MF5533) TaxID=1104152 RepID=H0EEU9_GLAL7|nr:putative Peptidyl-prolyl isomerase CWC27 [Glarea lozoyensis 74030]